LSAELRLIFEVVESWHVDGDGASRKARRWACSKTY